MTEFSFSSFPQFPRHCSPTMVAHRLGKTIVQEKGLVFSADLEETVCLYDSYDIAVAFWQVIYRQCPEITPLRNLTNPLNKESTPVQDYCQDIIDSINNENFNLASASKDLLKSSFTFLIAFGFPDNLVSNRSFTSWLDWSCRRYAERLTFYYKRLDNLNSIIEENLNGLFLSSNLATDHFRYYSSTTFNNYTVNDLEVYSKIPEKIALDFSYKFQVQETHRYSDSEYVIQHPACRLSAGLSGDIVFEEFAKEDYLALMNSSDKIEASYIKSPYRGNTSLEKALVRKRTLKKACSIVPVISDCIALNPVTLETYKIKLLRIRINAPRLKFLKYNKSKNFLSSLSLKFFSHEGLAWINEAAYKVKMREMLGNLSKYDSNFVNLFIATNVDISAIDINSNSLISAKISDSDFRYHEASSITSMIPELQNIEKIEKTLKELKDKNTKWKDELATKTYSFENSPRVVRRFQESIDYFREQLEDISSRKEKELLDNQNRIVEIERLKTNVSAIQGTLSQLSEQASTFKKIKLATVMDSADDLKVDWLKNIKSSNIDFHSCFYTLPAIILNDNLIEKLIFPTEAPSLSSEADTYGRKLHINIKDCPQLAYYAQEKTPINPELIFGEDYQTILDSNNISPEQLIPSLTYIYFSTIKPSIIKVDGSNTNQVVGGPYHVEVNAGYNYYNSGESLSPSLIIKLKDESSVFGYDSSGDGFQVWVHPHTQYMKRNIDSSFYNTIMSWQARACLGEAQAPIYKAFQNSNVRSAVFAAKIWIESANSTDTWGRNYKKFPKVSDLNFDNSDTLEAELPQAESQEITEVEVNEMLQDLMEQANNNTLEQAPVREVAAATQVSEQDRDPPCLLSPTPSTERINGIIREAIQGAIGQTEPVVVESPPHDSPLLPAYTTYAEVTGN